MPYIEVDQSGKIEQFDRDTVVALSNDKEYSVLIPKKVKQTVFMSQKTNIPDLKYKLFSIALFYCIREHLDHDRMIVICSEYERKEAVIKSFLVKLFEKIRLNGDYSLIRFGRITKKSPAHKLAISVFRKTTKPKITLTTEQIISKIIK